MQTLYLIYTYSVQVSGARGAVLCCAVLLACLVLVFATVMSCPIFATVLSCLAIVMSVDLLYPERGMRLESVRQACSVGCGWWGEGGGRRIAEKGGKGGERFRYDMI